MCRLFFLFLVILCLGKLGDIRLGNEDEKPEFSFFPGCACCFQPVWAIPQTDRRPGFPERYVKMLAAGKHDLYLTDKVHPRQGGKS
nr:BCCT family transporter [Megasphaera elsdenii]